MSACTRRSLRDPTTASPPFVVGLSAVGVVTTLAIVAFAGLGDEVKTGGRAVPGRAAVTVKTDVTPRPPSLRGHARRPIDVVVDRDAVAPGLPRVVRSFAPYVVDGVTTVRRDVGQFSQLRYTFRLRCLRANCLPTSGRANVRFDPVRVLYRSPAGEPRVVRASWPRVELYSRLASVPKEEQSTSRLNTPVMAPWRADLTALPPVSHRSSPTLIIAVLLLAAGLLVLPACVLVYLALPWRASPSWESWLAQLPPIERALAVLERARTQGDATARRRALERLGMELRARGRGPRARSSRARLDGDDADVRGDPAPRAARSPRRRGWASSCRVDASFGRCPRFRRPTSARSRRTRAAPAACAQRSPRSCSASSSPACCSPAAQTTRPRDSCRRGRRESS